jgi:uncharacterized phiE125 gp8 family phage protein
MITDPTGNLDRVVAPTVQPVTLDQVKNHLRITHADEDEVLTAFIAAAAAWYERLTQRALTLATYRQTFDTWPVDYRRTFGGTILLARAPVVSVTSIKFLDQAGVEQTVDPAVYRLDASGIQARVIPVTTWPSHGDKPAAVRVNYTAGVSTAAEVDPLDRAAVMMLVAHLDKHREPTITGTIVQQVPMTVESIVRMRALPSVW